MAITARRSFGTTFPNGRFLHWSTNGYTMSVDWESYKEFDTNPAFGKACKTYKVTFVIPKE